MVIKMTHSNDKKRNIVLELAAIDFEMTTETEGFEPEPLTLTMNRQDSVPSLPALIVYHTDVSDHNHANEMSERLIMSEDFAKLSVGNHPCDVNKTPDDDTGIRSSYTSQQKAMNLLLYLPDEDGDTTLHISIMHRDEKKSAAIINCAPDFVYLNVYNNLRQTPAHLAAFTNHSKILRKLMCAGADISCQDIYGNTPLHIACKHGYRDVIQQLLTPIDYTETMGNRHAIPFAAIPQDMNMKNVDGLTCLHLSVLQNNVDIVRLLMEAGADVNLGDSKSGRTALHLAAEHGMLDVVTLFISYPRTNADVQTYADYTPFQLAHYRGHREVTKLLIQKSFVCLCGFCLYRCESSSDYSDIDSTDSDIDITDTVGNREE